MWTQQRHIVLVLPEIEKMLKVILDGIIFSYEFNLDMESLVLCLYWGPQFSLLL